MCASAVCKTLASPTVSIPHSSKKTKGNQQDLRRTIDHYTEHVLWFQLLFNARKSYDTIRILTTTTLHPTFRRQSLIGRADGLVPWRGDEPHGAFPFFILKDGVSQYGIDKSAKTTITFLTMVLELLPSRTCTAYVPFSWTTRCL